MNPVARLTTTLLAVTASPLLADVFYPIAAIETDPATANFYPVINLIQGAGVGFDGDPAGAHDSISGGAAGSWVTTDPAGGAPADYIEDVGVPVLILDLGSDTLLEEISVWGYSSANANGCSLFSLRFATDAEGKTGFGSSVLYNPTFERFFPDALIRDSFEFSGQVTARYVEFTCLDNFWNAGQSPPGGDRVGLSEIAFRVASESGGPNILVPAVLRVLNDGTSQTIDISVFNNGDAPLNISTITVSGADQASYTPGPVPGPIAPGTSALTTVAFQPAGITGDSTVSVAFASDDPDEPTKTLELTLAFPSFYNVQDVVSTADEDFNFEVDLYSSLNLIQGPGIGFDANPPHRKTSTGAQGNWVTAADAGGAPADYIDLVTQPVLRFDLGEDSLLTEISVWGYAITNANGVSEFSLRFATAADGAAGFGASVAYNPVFTGLSNDDSIRQSFPFSQPVTARYVEFTCLDNFWNQAGTPPGGDRVGLGEVGFEIPVIGDDATIEVPPTLALDLDGTVQTFTIDVRNTGAPDLTVTGLTFTGPDAAAFSQVSLPGPISTFNTGAVTFRFNPAGLAGPVSANLEIASDDPNTPTAEVQLAGIRHDPQIATVDPGAFELPAAPGARQFSVLIGNIGAAQPLSISDISVSGVSAANFTINSPPTAIAPSETADINFTFDPLGADGTFAASIDITTDDPVNPLVSIPLLVRVAIADPLVAHWPLDDAVGSLLAADTAGANPGDATLVTFGLPGRFGTAAEFDGFESTINVPFTETTNPPSFTVVAWALPRFAGGAYQSVITSRADANPDRGGYVLYNDINGNWAFWSAAGVASPWNALGGGPVLVDDWTHLALSYDDVTRTKTIYVNGVAAISATVGIQPNGSIIELPQSDLHIGSGADLGDQFFFDGLIDDVAVFRTALSPADIQSIIDNGVAGFANPGAGGDTFSITSFAFDAVTRQLDFTFTNPPQGAPLVLRRSTDLINWVPVDNSVTTSPFSFTDTTLPAGVTTVYYRLDNLPE